MLTCNNDNPEYLSNGKMKDIWNMLIENKKP